MEIGKLILYLLIIEMTFLFSCKKVEKEMAVSTGFASNILTKTAEISGEVIDIGEGATQYGHCYSTIQNPTASLTTKTEKGIPVIGKYTSNLTNLSASTKYYVRAFVSRGTKVKYGEQIEFITASDSKPQITTKNIISKTKTSAVTGGDIINEGGTSIIAKGICWGLAPDPIIDGNPNKTNDGPGNASFTSNMTGLSAGKYYYVRAYATNDGGTSYGNQVEFWTESDINTPPTVITSIVSSVTATTALCGGNVTFEGGSSVYQRGVCWSLNVNPKTENFFSNEGTGGGAFTSNLDQLTPGTTYHVRAYAINTTTTSYGTPEFTFITCRAPLATTNGVTFGSASVILNGVANANSINDSITKVSFDYGPSTNYGSTVSATPESLTGSNNVNISANITGLIPNTIYHYRVKAVNCGGTIYGTDQTFSFLNETGINDTLLLCYSRLSAYIEFIYLFDAIYSNNITPPSSSWNDIYNHTQTCYDQKVLQLWSMAYDIIYKTNLVINSAELVITDQTLRHTIIAQAKAIRAYLYYNLLIWFGGVPIEMGVSDNLNPRAFDSEVLELIRQDAAEAAQYLPLSWLVSENFRVTQSFARGIQVRASMYNNNSSSALTYDLQIINSGSYTLSTEIDNFSSTNSEIFWGFPKCQIAEFCTFFTKGTFVPVIRLTESYLVAAEAYYTLGNMTDALNYINALMVRRGSAPLATLTSNDIFHQLNTELEKEGNMFITLKRFNKATSVLLIESYKLLLPIPMTILDKNPNIMQNVGY